MKTIQLFKTMILLGFAIFIGQLLVSGNLDQYVHPRFSVSLSMGGCFFVLLAIIQTGRFFSAHHYEDCGFKHELLTCLLLAMPLICALLIPSSTLGADMIDKKTTTPASQVNTGSSANIQQQNEWDPLIREDRFLAAMMVLYLQPSDYVNRDIEFSGFVYHQDDFPEGCFLVARYGITCCTADAQVTGLLCRFPEERKIADDQWVRIRGKITVQSFQERDIPVVEVSSLQFIKAPSDPYVY